jgi:hypothetical protein
LLILRENSTGTIEGIAVLKIKDKEGLKTGAILDALSVHRSRRAEVILLRECMRKSASEGCELVVRLESPDRKAAGPVRSLLLLRTSRTLRFIVRPIGEAQLPREAFALDSWHVEFIDLDVF